MIGAFQERVLDVDDLTLDVDRQDLAVTGCDELGADCIAGEQRTGVACEFPLAPGTSAAPRSSG